MASSHSLLSNRTQNCFNFADSLVTLCSLKLPKTVICSDIILFILTIFIEAALLESLTFLRTMHWSKLGIGSDQFVEQFIDFGYKNTFIKILYR